MYNKTCYYEILCLKAYVIDDDLFVLFIRNGRLVLNGLQIFIDIHILHLGLLADTFIQSDLQ